MKRVDRELESIPEKFRNNSQNFVKVTYLSTISRYLKELIAIQTFLVQRFQHELNKISHLDIPSFNTVSSSNILSWLEEWLGSYSEGSKLGKLTLTKSKARKAILACLSEAWNQLAERKLQDTKSIFKNLLVIKKCNDTRQKISKPTRCKLCEEELSLDQLADHSFKCFEKKTLHLELNKINKMMLKLRTTCTKNRTLLSKFDI